VALNREKTYLLCMAFSEGTLAGVGVDRDVRALLIEGTAACPEADAAAAGTFCALRSFSIRARSAELLPMPRPLIDPPGGTAPPESGPQRRLDRQKPPTANRALREAVMPAQLMSP
jgi:hypothetical protein